MPTYLFKDIDTGDVGEHFIKMSEYDSYLVENPSLQRYYDSAHMGALISGINNKPDPGFREVLRNIKKKHKRSTINDF